MSINFRVLRRPLYALTAYLMLVATLLMGLLPANASAAQITTRSIKMSSSNAGNANTSYNVVFNPGQSTTIGGIIVDFCANTPIIGDTSCTLPTSFTLGTTPAVTINSGLPAVGGSWTTAGIQGGAAASNFQVLKLTNGTPQSVATGTPVDFTITTVTNPNVDNTSFYARIVTFDTSANTTSQYTASGTTRAATFANMVDYGGIAMSTGKVINITAKVMENLALCVYKTTCTDDPSFTIGHGANNILDTSAVDTATVNFSISTNAQGTTTVRIKGDTLKAGSNDIDAPGGASAITFSAGTEKFGLRISTAGSFSPVAPYNGAAGDYGLNTTNSTSTYGESMGTFTGPVNNSVTTVTYGATAGATTAAGIYTAAHQYIATASF
jgi:hypothetical protein